MYKKETGLKNKTQEYKTTLFFNETSLKYKATKIAQDYKGKKKN